MGFASNLRRTTRSPAISLALLVAGLVAVVLYLLMTFSWVNHTNVVIQRALLVEKLLLDLQTATRGYYLTRDSRFLEPYKASRPELPIAIAALIDEVADNPLQLAAAREIERDANTWLAWTTETLNTATTEGTRPEVGELWEGKTEFDHVRQDVDQFLQGEYDLRDQRSRDASRTVWTSLAIATLATVLVAIVQCRAVKRRLHAISHTYREALRLAKERRIRTQELLKELDAELKAVGEIQRSLLPLKLPAIPGLELAASYQPSRRAGGDYYDFFRLPPEHPDDMRVRYGILIADVSGHGSPAAVLMAVTHSIAHGFEKPTSPPGELLGFVNRRLCDGYTTDTGRFVTAFYAIYDPSTRELTYSSAGHNPPRLRPAGATKFEPLDQAQGYPLGIVREEEYPIVVQRLQIGDTVAFYTDGITEARGEGDEQLGLERLDAALSAPESGDPDEMLAAAMSAVRTFAGEVPEDDRTLLVIRVCPDGAGDADFVGNEGKQAVIVESPIEGLEALGV